MTGYNMLKKRRMVKRGGRLAYYIKDILPVLELSVTQNYRLLNT